MENTPGKYYTLSRLYQCRRGTITLKLMSKDIIEQMSVSHPLNISVAHAKPKLKLRSTTLAVLHTFNQVLND